MQILLTFPLNARQRRHGNLKPFSDFRLILKPLTSHFAMKHLLSEALTWHSFQLNLAAIEGHHLINIRDSEFVGTSRICLPHID